MSSIASFIRGNNGTIENFTKARQKQIRNAERRGREPQGRPFITRGFNMVHPAIAAAAAGVTALMKPIVPVTAPAAPVVASVAKKTPTPLPTADGLPSAKPSASSGAFKALMVGILSAPKAVTKDDLIGIAGTYSVTVKKSWKKDQILTVLAEACGLTYTP